MGYPIIVDSDNLLSLLIKTYTHGAKKSLFNAINYIHDDKIIEEQMFDCICEIVDDAKIDDNLVKTIELIYKEK